MVVYVKDGVEYSTLGEIRRAFPLEIFPRNPDDKALKALGITKEEREGPKPVEPTPEEIADQELKEAKEERAKAVAAIKVAVGDKVFDGDEAAQQRMTCALMAADAAGLDSTDWVLADNRVVTVTKAELKQALALSMLEMGKLWTKPYEAQKAKA